MGLCGWIAVVMLNPEISAIAATSAAATMTAALMDLGQDTLYLRICDDVRCLLDGFPRELKYIGAIIVFGSRPLGYASLVPVLWSLPLRFQHSRKFSIYSGTENQRLKQ